MAPLRVKNIYESAFNSNRPVHKKISSRPNREAFACKRTIIQKKVSVKRIINVKRIIKGIII